MEGTVLPFMMDIEVDTFDRYHAGSPWEASWGYSDPTQARAQRGPPGWRL
jgi:hypothetical protein